MPNYIECEECGHTYNSEEHEYCPYCDEEDEDTLIFYHKDTHEKLTNITPEDKVNELIETFSDLITSDNYPQEAVHCAYICAKEIANMDKDNGFNEKVLQILAKKVEQSPII